MMSSGGMVIGGSLYGLFALTLSLSSFMYPSAPHLSARRLAIAWAWEKETGPIFPRPVRSLRTWLRAGSFSSRGGHSRLTLPGHSGECHGNGRDFDRVSRPG